MLSPLLGRLFVCAAVSAGMLLDPAPARKAGVPPKEIALLSEDGHPFFADFYVPQEAERYLVVLVVPNLGNDRKSLGAFPADLASRGYGVMVMDNTGQTRSIVKVNGRMKFNEARVKDFDRYLFDLKAATAAMRLQPGADAKSFGLVGVGIGANIGLLYASQTPEVGTAAFLLPGFGCPGYDSSELLIRYGQRPALLANSNSKNVTDFSKAFDAQALSVKSAPREHRVLPLRGLAAGENEISGHDGLNTAVFDWLDRTLPKQSHP